LCRERPAALQVPSPSYANADGAGLPSQGQLEKPEQFEKLGWRRGSVVRTSVFDWQTFPNIRLIYG